MYNSIQILGDYNSSTKYLHNLCEKNLKIKVSSGDFLHKHQYFPIEFIEKNPNILFIIVYRNFISWVGSCYRNPHLFRNKKGLIKHQSRTVNYMIKWEIGFQNEYTYGTQSIKEFYKKLGITWYQNLMDYRNKKTEFYLKLLKYPNVIAINDKYLVNNSESIIKKISSKHNIDLMENFINIQYVKNWTIYRNIDSKYINQRLNHQQEKLLNNNSLQI